jgi:hypothetical protein
VYVVLEDVPASAAKSKREWFASARSADDPLCRLAANFTPISNAFTHAPAATIDCELTVLLSGVGETGEGAAAAAADEPGIDSCSRCTGTDSAASCPSRAVDAAFLLVTGIYSLLSISLAGMRCECRDDTQGAETQVANILNARFRFRNLAWAREKLHQQNIVHLKYVRSRELLNLNDSFYILAR